MGVKNLLFELSFYEIREYLELAVRVRAETVTGCNTILIDDTKRTKLLVIPVLVPTEDVRQLW